MVIMKKFRYIIIVILIMVSFNLFSQKKFADDSVRMLTNNSISLFTASVLPHFVSYQTFFISQNNRTKYFYGGIWFSFGLTLDIGAVNNLLKIKKLKKYEKL